mmetsp:Transcript_3269/g.8075  ORF Transcript_3269/g.8075 Transcript_3269/m.8075 type:complete len:372 (+) Transcript_3269:277-1392(+)
MSFRTLALTSPGPSSCLTWCRPSPRRTSRSSTATEYLSRSPRYATLASSRDTSAVVACPFGLLRVANHSSAVASHRIAWRRISLQSMPECRFNPLMTLYLTDDTPADEVWKAKEEGVVGFKLYPAGATTNSSSGVTDVKRCHGALKAMESSGMVLLVHGEVTDPEIDIFDREKVFIETTLAWILNAFPHLKVVLEHITTSDAVNFVSACPSSIGATITPQHILMNRNMLFQRGIRPHHFCLPVLKRETHRREVTRAATSGDKHFFMGTDSAPHTTKAKISPCGCAGIYSAPVALSVYAKVFEQERSLANLEKFATENGPAFYGLPKNTNEEGNRITLVKEPWVVPQRYRFGSDHVVPLCAGMTLPWKVTRE